MKVTSLTPPAASPAAPPALAPSGAEPAAPVARSSALLLSDAARAPGAVPQSPLQTASRLSELRDAIDEGRYNINATLIAERLLQWQL